MRDLADKYGRFEFAGKGVQQKQQNGRTYVRSRSGRELNCQLLTGATGSLGTYLLHEILAHDSTDRVVCLVRAKDDVAGANRVREAMTARNLRWDTKRVAVYASDLSLDDLGAGQRLYQNLTERVDVVIHVSLRLMGSVLTVGGVASALCEQLDLIRR
jgi:hypothetical protein